MTVRPSPSYVFSQDAVVNVATANNYMSLFNPVGSGKLILIGGIFISSTLLTSSSITASLRGWRTTAASGGTLQLDSAITKAQMQFPDDIKAEVRTGNPTCTRTTPFFNSPAPITDKAAPVHVVTVPPGTAPFSVPPGNGIVLRTEAGIGVGATWNLSVAWAEVG